jgi:4'-phosphopantetheinyl transferase
MPNKSSIPPLPLPKDSAAEIWVVDLRASDQSLEAANGVLNQDELERARRFRFPADKRRFVMARATAREILGRYLKTAPQSLVFEYGEYGKPQLLKPSVDLRFNTSRSGEKALIACTMGREIGVDIEWIHRDIEIDDLAQRFFTAAENIQLQKFPPPQRHHAFLRCWTCKEAFVKAVGKGLSLGLDQFDVSAGIGDPEARAPITVFVVNGWSLAPFASSDADNYISALAVEGKEIAVVVQDWIR